MANTPNSSDEFRMDDSHGVDEEIVDLLNKDDDDDDSFLTELPFFEEEDTLLSYSEDSEDKAAKPSAPNKPEPPQKKQKESKGIIPLLGRRLLWPILLIAIVLLLWFYTGSNYQDRTDLSTEEPFTPLPEEALFDEESADALLPPIGDTLVVEPPGILPLPAEPESPEQRELPPQPKKFWYVQAGICSFQACVQDLSERLTRLGLSTKTGKRNKAYPFVELYSSELFSEADAYRYTTAINNVESQIPRAFTQKLGDRHRIVMGLFVTVENAKKIRRHLESYLNSEAVRFKMRKVFRKSASSIIYAGPFASKNEANEALRDIRDFALITDAFLRRF